MNYENVSIDVHCPLKYLESGWRVSILAVKKISNLAVMRNLAAKAVNRPPFLLREKFNQEPQLVSFRL